MPHPDNRLARRVSRALLATLFATLVLAGCAPVAHKPGSLPPAALPDHSEVAPGQATAIDGEWKISTIGKRIRIERGRAWAVDGWVHFFSSEIRPGMVVIRDLRRSAAGRFRGKDLPLSGDFRGRIEGDFIDVSVGAVRYRLLPVKLADRRWFERERLAALTAQRPIAELPRPVPRKPRKPSARGCGGEGEHPCKIVAAKRVGKAAKLGCKGKQSYFSTLRGGSCWSCPKGYKRASPTRRMDHAKACKKRKSLRGPWTQAKFQKRAWGCPKGQFHMAKRGGSCMKCPKGYKRIHAAGADTGRCRPVKRCDRGLRVAKQPPEKNAFANLIGASSAKLCAPPFDIKAAARRDIKGYGFLPELMQNLTRELLTDVKKRRRTSLKKLFKAKRWQEAYAVLNDRPAFRALADAARAQGNRSISVGVVGDVQLLVGANGEIGIAIDLVDKKIKPYESAGISKGLAVGIESAVNVGIWKGSFESGYSQGFSTSVSAVVSIGAGVWYSYFHPRKGQEHLLGVTVSAGAGVGAEIGEYNEVGTWLLAEVFAAN